MDVMERGRRGSWVDYLSLPNGMPFCFSWFARYSVQWSATSGLNPFGFSLQMDLCLLFLHGVELFWVAFLCTLVGVSLRGFPYQDLRLRPCLVCPHALWPLFALCFLNPMGVPCVLTPLVMTRDLKLVSLNFRGLNHPTKCAAILSLLEQAYGDICMLQETHLLASLTNSGHLAQQKRMG